MGQNARQRGRKPKAVGQHVFVARLAEFVAEILISVENLSEDSFSARQVHIALLYRRTGRVPLSRSYKLFQPGVILWIVLLHQAIAIRTGPIEDVMRILL